jgi:hypothetical protein
LFVRNSCLFESGPNVTDRTLLRLAITQYVDSHPLASDTLAGIAEWWLPRDMRPTSLELEDALDELVVEGILRRRELPGGTKLYSAGDAGR